MSQPAISVVTLTWNSSRFIRPLLDSLLADADESEIPIEVIVIDNGSTDGSLELIRSYHRAHDFVRLVALSRNMGTTVSRNIGIRAARADLILILDSDIEVVRGSLRGLLDSVGAIPDPASIGIVCPRLVFPDGEFQESARRFPTVMTKLYRLMGLEDLRTRDESVDAVLAGQTVPVDYGASAAWLVPRSTFDRVGLLDETIFYAPEDVEFCARCWEHGLKVWFYPAVELVHCDQRITYRKPLTRLGLSHAKGLARFWWKYHMFFTRPERG